MKTFIIKDWAGNILNCRGGFDRPSHAMALEFNDFDAAEDYLIGLLGDEYEDCRGEYYILVNV